jgi:uncharacterized protein (DUF58 family)
VSLQDLVFPLIPRRRMVGLAYGAMHSARRGMGSDVAGSRPYRPGDDVDTIDWAASAKLSSARDTEEFVVREHYADEAPRVVIVCDRRPEMALCPRELPWLRKYEAMALAAEIISESTTKAQGFVGYLDFASGEEPFWRPPASGAEHWAIQDRHLAWPDFKAPQDTIERALDFLGSGRRTLPAGSFLFLLSDFLVPPSRDAWTRALEQRWDLAPVVIQDPVWESSFPQVDGIVVPFADAEGSVRLVRLRRGEAERCRREHEERRTRLLAELESLGIEPILVSSTNREEVFRAFLGWSDERTFRRGHGG